MNGKDVIYLSKSAKFRLGDVCDEIRQETREWNVGYERAVLRLLDEHDTKLKATDAWRKFQSLYVVSPSDDEEALLRTLHAYFGVPKIPMG